MGCVRVCPSSAKKPEIIGTCLIFAIAGAVAGYLNYGPLGAIAGFIIGFFIIPIMALLIALCIILLIVVIVATYTPLWVWGIAGLITIGIILFIRKRSRITKK